MRLSNAGSRFQLAAVFCSAALATGAAQTATQFQTTTPIKHLVVIFQENVSFDHYFATYPVAQNPGGEPLFVAVLAPPMSTASAGPC
jgi:phospholipase C